MKKILVTIAMSIDEKELEKIENYQDEYKNNMTLEKWVSGLNVLYTGDGNITIGNEIEEYYNQNLGESKVLNGIEVKGYEISK